MLEGLHFIRPYWLLLLPAVVAIWWLMGSHAKVVSVWNRICDPALIAILSTEKNVRHVYISRRNLICIPALLATLALAGPSWDRHPDILLQDRTSLIIAIDLSSSMLTRDVEPSRYQRALLKIEELLDEQQVGNVALIAYAANAYAVTPLTRDAATLKALVPALSPVIMPRQGSNTSEAVKLAGNLLQRSNLKEGSLLLVTDGIGNDNIQDVVTISDEYGLHISILGMGTVTGAKVPAMNNIGFMETEAGVVTSSLDIDSLSELADKTGGIFVQSRADTNDIENLLVFFQKRRAQHERTDETGSLQWVDRGSWIVLLCLPFAVLLFRRNLVFLLVLGWGMTPHIPVEATELEDYFRNSDQRGLAAYNREDFAESARLFSDLRWQAAAAYRMGDWQKAYELYSQLLDTESIYNRGNTLVFLARLEEAVLAYNEVLKKDSQHKDAAHNKSEVLALMKKLYPESGMQNREGNSEKGQHEKKKINDEQQKSNKSDQEESREQQDNQQQAEQSSGNVDDVPVSISATKPSDTSDASTAEVGNVESDLDEETLAEEQWLRRIVDDPAGLMRRKFLEQYRDADSKKRYSGEPW